MRIHMLVLGALLCAASLGAGAADGDVQVKDAWIRWLPGGVPGAGYLTLINNGEVERVLVGASSPDFGEVSVHRTHSHDGMSMMEPVPSLVLKPHATVQFAAGGYHFMLMQPKRALQPGDKVMVTLRLRDGGTVAAAFEVRAAASP